MRHTAGFTFMELMLVIAIMGLLTIALVSNFRGTQQKARDIKRKQELVQVKSALRLYYNDYQKYPEDYPEESGGKIKGCGENGTSECPVCTTADFAAGGADGCGTVYMRQLPENFGEPTGASYYQVSSGDDFRLKVSLETTTDPEIARSQARCPTGGWGRAIGIVTCADTDYCVCAD